MNYAVLIVEILALIAMVLVHRRQLKGLSSFFEDRLRAQDEAEEGRRVALYKQQKATQKTVAQSDRAVRKLADQTSGLQEDARQALAKIDRFVSDSKEGQ